MEQIGLQAVLADKEFTAGVDRYIAGITRMVAATAGGSTAINAQLSNLTSAFKTIANNVGNRIPIELDVDPTGQLPELDQIPVLIDQARAKGKEGIAVPLDVDPANQLPELEKVSEEVEKAKATGLRGILINLDLSRFLPDLDKVRTGMASIATGANQASNQLQSAFGGIGGFITDIAAGLLNVGKILVTAVAAGATAVAGALTGVGVASTNMAMNMEASLSNIQSLLGVSKDEVAGLGSLIEDLGIDPKLKVTAQEAAQAIEMLANNGLTAGQIMAGAARNTVLLANATGAEFGNAAKIATDTMSLFNIEADRMGTAVSGITAVVNNSKFTIDDYRLALAQGGGVAASLGVSFDDFNATITATASLFGSGSDAGTSFKGFLQRLIPTSNEAEDAMEALGIITAEGANRFFDAEGKMRGMADIAGVLQETLGGLSDQQKNQALSTIFGADAMRTAVGLMNLGADSAGGATAAFKGLKDELRKTDAEESAAIRMDNLKGVLEIIGGVIETVGLQIGNELIPPFRLLADQALSFANEAGPKIVEMFAKGAEVLTTFIQALLDGQSPIEALRTSLVGLVSPEFLDSFDTAVVRMMTFRDFIANDVIPTLVTFGNWFMENRGPILATIEGVAVGIGTLVIATTAAGWIASLATAISTVITVMTTATTISSGFAALLGGPVVVAIAAVALALGGMTTAYQNYKNTIKDVGTAVDNSIQKNLKLAESSPTDAFKKFTEALDATTESPILEWVPELAAKQEELKEAMAEVIAKNVDLTASSEAYRSAIVGGLSAHNAMAVASNNLTKSLQAQFGESVKVVDGMVMVNGEAVVSVQELNKLQEAYSTLEEQQRSTAASEQLTEQWERQNALLQPNTEYLLEKANAERESAFASELLASQEAELNDKLLQRAAVAEEAAIQEAALAEATDQARFAEEAFQYRLELGNEVIQEAKENSLALADEVSAAYADLQLANFEGDAEAAEAAQVRIQEALTAVSDSYRQMVMDIFIAQANLAGGFNESAANIAVSLGIMTQEEANLRLETQETTRQIGLLSERMLATFLEDGVVSREEAKQLADAVAAIEDGTITAGEGILAFTQGGLAELITQGGNAKDAMTDTRDSMIEASEAATTESQKAYVAWSGKDWASVGSAISAGVAGGITSGGGEVETAAVGVVMRAIRGAKEMAGISSPSRKFFDEVGIPIAEGAALGISSMASMLVLAGSGMVGDVFDGVYSNTDQAEDAGYEVGDRLAQGLISSLSVIPDLAGQISQQLADDLTDDEKKHWQDVLETADEGGAQWLEAYNKLQADLTDSQRNALVARLAGLEGEVTSTAEMMDNLLGVASKLGSLGSGFSNVFKRQTLDPLKDQLDAIDDSLSDIGKGPLEDLMKQFKPESFAQLGDIVGAFNLRLTGEQNSALVEAIRLEQERAAEEYADAQAHILELQKQQQDLQFLKQQFDLLQLIKDNGLDSSAILGGLELGINADVPSLIDAMTRAMQQIVDAANSELGIASPSKVFRAMGMNVTDSFVAGVDTSLPRAQGFMANEFVPALVNPVVNVPPMVTALQSQSVSNSSSITNTNYNDYNLSLNTRETSMGVRDSFRLMEALNG